MVYCKATNIAHKAIIHIQSIHFFFKSYRLFFLVSILWNHFNLRQHFWKKKWNQKVQVNFKRFHWNEKRATENLVSSNQWQFKAKCHLSNAYWIRKHRPMCSHPLNFLLVAIITHYFWKFSIYFVLVPGCCTQICDHVNLLFVQSQIYSNRTIWQ